MKTSLAAVVALLAFVTALSASGHAQSTGAAAGGGATAGAAGGGAFGGAGNVGIGAQNPAFNRSGANTNSAFGPQQFQRPFVPGQPFSQANQFGQFNQPPFNQNQQGAFNQDRFNRNERFLQRQAGNFDQAGPGGFAADGENSFSQEFTNQDMTNQGAFGLGNGNRSSFFDNQPFNNNQAFGQGSGAGAGANSSAGFTAANDPAGFTGTGSTFDDATEDFDDRFDSQTGADASFRGQQSGLDVSSSRASSEFATTSDAERRTGAGTGANSSRGLTAANDPPGFTGTTSPLSRSRPLGEGTSAEDSVRGTSRTGPATTGRGSVGGNFSQDRSFSGQDAVSAPSDVDTFSPTGTGTFNNDATTATEPNATAELLPGRVPIQNFDPSVRRDGFPRGNGVFDFPPPPGARNVLYGSGGYGFMQQYSNPSAAANQPRADAFNANRPGVSSGNATGVRPNAAPGVQRADDENSVTPNYFNGSYSRTRL
jgi:hypothetical protein